MPLGGGAPRELLEDVREARWSPNGDELAVIHVVDGRQRLEYPIGRVLYEAAWMDEQHQRLAVRRPHRLR